MTSRFKLMSMRLMNIKLQFQVEMIKVKIRMQKVKHTKLVS